jgi:hypothetical protein
VRTISSYISSIKLKTMLSSNANASSDVVPVHPPAAEVEAFLNEVVAENPATL